MSNGEVFQICVTEDCAEYLIKKASDLPADKVVCGTCGQPMSEDDGRGVPVEDRPNPEEPLVLPDPTDAEAPPAG